MRRAPRDTTASRRSATRRGMRLAALLHDRGRAPRDGKREREAGASLRPVLRPDATALRLDEAVCDGETQARAATGARARRVAPPEALEHPLLRLAGQPDTGVLDRYLELGRAPLRPHDDGAVGGRV